jgi:hypothetical protein
MLNRIEMEFCFQIKKDDTMLHAIALAMRVRNQADGSSDKIITMTRPEHKLPVVRQGHTLDLARSCAWLASRARHRGKRLHRTASFVQPGFLSNQTGPALFAVFFCVSISNPAVKDRHGFWGALCGRSA